MQISFNEKEKFEQLKNNETVEKTGIKGESRIGDPANSIHILVQGKKKTYDVLLVMFNVLYSVTF